MSSSNQNAEQAEAQFEENSAASVGTLLREAREQAGLTSDELAGRLCMTSEKLEALERDEFDRFPGATYVRGYVRNISKELGLEEAGVLEALARQVPTEAPRVAQVPKGPVMGGTSSSGGGFLSRPLFLVAVIAVAGGYWWFEMQGGKGAAPAAMVASSDSPAAFESSSETSFEAVSETPSQSAVAENASDADGALGDQTLAVSSPEQMEETPENVPETDAQVAMIAETITDESAVETADAAEVEVAQAEPIAPVSAPAAPEMEPAAPALEQSASDIAAPALAEEPITEASGAVVSSAALALSFSEESWVEVTDATGSKLLAKLQPAGSSIELKGEAPFSLMLGNAAATTVSYAGEVVDSAPLGNRRTRKLTVGG